MLQNPSVCRAGSRCTPSSIDELIHCFVFHGTVPAKQLAERIGVTYARLANAANPNRTENVFPARWVEAIILETGDVRIVQYLAAKLNCAVVELPSAVLTSDEIYQRVADVVREFGESTAVLQASLADGVFTSEELARYDREVDDTVIALLEAKAAVHERFRLRTNPTVNGDEGVRSSQAPRPTPAKMHLDSPASARKARRA